MKIWNTALAVLLIGTLFVGNSSIYTMADETPELEQGGWMKPTINDVNLEIKNSTGFFRFDLDALGSSPEGTERVEITFGGLNGSKIEVAEDLWFEEGNVFLFIYGSTLEQVEGNYPWNNWSFNIWLALPVSGGIEGALTQLGGLFGFDTGNLSSEDIGNISMEDFDLQNLTEMFQENRFYLIARSYNETDAWGQEAFDLTDRLYTALLQFMIDEGWIENPFTDDDDTVPADNDDESKDKEGVSSWILIGIFLTGIITLLAVIAVVTFMALSSKSKE